MTSYCHDGIKCLESLSAFQSQHFRFSYDAVGNLLTKTDRKSQTIDYTYDNLNRLTRKENPDASGVDYSYDNAGRLVAVEDATGTYQFTYDNLGRLTGASTTYSFLPSRTFTISYSYDAAGNRISMLDPENGTTDYVYDALNRLTSLTNFQSQQFTFSYDGLSRRTQLTRPNGVNTNYTYDNLSRLLSVLHQIGGNTIDGASYTVDPVGNRTSKTNHLNSEISNFTYDAIYQLTQALLNSQTTETYTYDAVGNRLSSLGVSPYTYNSSNQLTSTPSASFTYDDNGNTTSKSDGTDVATYEWDFENRLVSVSLPDQSVVSFDYDPFGRRIRKVAAAATIFVYDGANIVEEVDGSGNVLASYTMGLGIDEPLAMLRGGAKHFYQADGLGSITGLSDSSGLIGGSYTYDSFGNLTTSTGSVTNSFRYTAREFDSESDHYFYRARYFHQAIGRFVNEDPIQFNGQDVNFFRFVRNRPTKYVDPRGLLVIDPDFDGNCLPDLQKALEIVKRVAKRDPRCNCLFRNTGSGRSLQDLVQDPDITIRYSSRDEYQRDRSGRIIGATFGHTPIYETRRFYIRPIACRYGRWAIAGTIVHELVHITTGAAPGYENEAERLTTLCGFEQGL